MKEAQAIERLRQVLRRQHKALATEDAYVLWLRRYIKALTQMPPALASEKKLEIFLTDLATVHDVSASTQNQAFNAVVYFYKEVLGQSLGNIKALRATRPSHERHAPSVTETQALLQTVPNQGGYPTNFIARMLYGCGLRVSEPLNLRIKDIDLEQRRLCIRGAKGGKDRVVAIPLSLVPELTQQMQLARVVWERDRHNNMPVMLPHALARKYPEYQFRWGWAWLFPAHQPCRDPRSGRIVRYRMHEVNVQRAVKNASRQLGISVLPHELRHGFATHSLERDINPRAIQEVMGHTSLETTMGYLHAQALSVPSPLDALPIPSPGIPTLPIAPSQRVPARPKTEEANRKPTVTAEPPTRTFYRLPFSARPHSKEPRTLASNPGHGLPRVQSPPQLAENRAEVYRANTAFAARLAPNCIATPPIRRDGSIYSGGSRRQPVVSPQPRKSDRSQAQNLQGKSYVTSTHHSARPLSYAHPTAANNPTSQMLSLRAKDAVQPFSSEGGLSFGKAPVQGASSSFASMNVVPLHFAPKIASGARPDVNGPPGRK